MKPLFRLVCGGLLLVALSAGCGVFDMKLHVVGDASAKGAAVFIDGAPVARLAAALASEAVLLRTSRPARGLERCYDLGDTILAVGQNFEDAFPTVKSGEHELWVISTSGDTLKTRIDCVDSPSVDVSFKCRVIEQVEW